MKINDNGIIRDMTPEEEAACAETPEMEIARLKQFLADTDYIACKIAEGSATKTEYKDIIAQRKAARTRIEELEPKEAEE